MRSLLLPALALGAGVLLSGTAARADDPDACGRFKWSVARERAALAAPSLASLPAGAPLPAIGAGALVALKPQAEVSYTVKPSRAPKVNPAYGTEIGVAGGSAAGGSVDVTLDEDAWVDVVQNGKVLRSTNFSGQKGCPDVRKSVRFTLAPGPFTIAISDAARPSVKLAVMASP